MGLIYGFDEFSNLSENKKVDNRVTCIKDFIKVLIVNYGYRYYIIPISSKIS